jgi:hypothetical protein
VSTLPKPEPVKFCEHCGKQLHRKRFNGRLEDYGVFLRRRFCDLSCGNSKAEVGKSAHHWRARKHRKDVCQECGSPANLDVHHKDRNPANDDPSNLATLCESCHLKLHWREDREKRLAAVQRPPEICVVCQGEFRPRHRRTQTCSPPCKAALLSQRTAAHYAGRETA